LAVVIEAAGGGAFLAIPLSKVCHLLRLIRNHRIFGH
jgi:hypothetical protein